MSVVAVLDEVSGIVGLLGLERDLLAGNRPLGVVHVKLEVRHDSEMIPVDRLLVETRTLLGHDSLHRTDDGACAAVTLLPILYAAAVGDHALDVAPILWHGDGG